MAYCSSHVEENKELLDIGKRLMKQTGLRPRDALHIASAAISRADYFITCDDKIRNKSEEISQALGYNLIVMNPTDFISERGAR